MRLTHFFIDRPIFATVLSVFVTLVGLGALAILPVAQYPEIVPPTVQVTTVYPGASAETVSRTVATPLEQQINGVESMLYMSSQSTGDGKLTITVTFRIGTDLNVAQMLTQNRVQNALSRLPEDVQRLGVQVRKATPNILLAVHLYSPDNSRDTLYMSNYATLHVKDALARLPGRRRRAVSGCSRLCHAHLARPGQGRGPGPQCQRGAGGLAGAEPPGLRRHPEPAAGTFGRGLPDQRPDARPAVDARAVRRHRREVRRPGAGHAHPRHRPGRDRRRRLRVDQLHGPRGRACRC